MPRSHPAAARKRAAPAPAGQQVAPVVMMGVAGCGKSSLGELVAAAMGWPMIEGDAFHSAQNKARMQAGVALTDADRQSWLEALGRELQAQPGGAVLSCSALKRSYREVLRAASPGLRFVFLDITPAAALERVKARAADHFFNPGLVDSQFAALQSPVGEPGVLRVDTSQPLPQLCDQVVEWLAHDTTPSV